MKRIFNRFIIATKSLAHKPNALLDMGVRGASSAISYANKNASVLDPYVAVLIAIVPILQHYLGVINNAATTVLVLLAPYLCLRLIPTLRNFKLSNLKFVFVLMVFFAYKLINHGTSFSEIAQVGIMLFYLLCLSQDVIDTKSLKRAAIIVAMIAGIALLFQYFCYYILKFHFKMVPISCLLSESEQWVLGAKTGLANIKGQMGRLYRPSAFFLEPSHLFMYSFPVLFISLFSQENQKINRIAAIIISVGMVLCTSGMGIAVVIGAWILFFAFGNFKDGTFKIRNILCKRNLILIISFLAVVALAIAFVPFVRNSVVRIFTNSEGSTAIDGRTEVALITLKKLTPIQLIFGVSDTTKNFKFNMPGFMATLYKYGIIGVLLSYEIYVKGLLKFNMSYFWYTVIILVASFFSAHTHGTFFMLYYVFLLKEGYNNSCEAWISGITEPVGNLFKLIKTKLFKEDKGKSL